MSNETLFFICGIALAVSAVSVSLVGLKVKDFPGRAFPLVILWFAILVGGATTFAVLHAKDEEKAKAAEFQPAGKKFEEEGSDTLGTEGAQGGNEEEAEKEAEAGAEGFEPVGPEESSKGAKSGSAAKGPGGTLQLAANPTELAYEQTSLSSKPGKVTIDFTNPATLEHDVAIEGPEGKELATSALIGKGKTSVSADLAPGTYHFFCTVPGHREAGMEGTLTVK
jgi:plastocyanin